MNHTHPEVRSNHLRLLLWSAVAGAASGGLALLFGEPRPLIRGAAFGLCLSLGIPLLNRVQKSHLDAGKPPEPSAVLAVGAGAGIVGGLIVALLGLGEALLLGERDKDFGVSSAGTGPTLLVGLCYGLALYGAYHLRWRFAAARTLKTVLLAALAGYLCGVLRAVFVDDEVGVWLLAGLFFGPPFALLWLWVLIRCDPAWSVERWRELTGQEAAQAA